MAKYVSGRQKNLKVGISSYSENLTSLEVIGNVGIATTNATSKLYVVGDGYFTGVVTASKFSGDGSLLTGVVSNSSGIIVQDEGNSVGALVTTLNFSGSSVSVSNSVNGISTVTITANGSITYVDTAGIATYATSAGIATYASSAGIATYASNAGISTYAGTAGIATNLKGGSNGTLVYQSSIDTTAFLSNGTSGQILQSNGGANPPSWVDAAPSNALTGLTVRDEGNIVGTANSISQLNFVGPIVSVIASSTGIATVTFLDYVYNAGIATYATSAGIATYASNAGIATNATYATSAGIATALQNLRIFEITGDIVASPISFNGTGNVSLAATIQPNSVALGSDTSGDYVQSISGTSNQITVTSGTGESSTPTLSIPTQFTAPQDVTITRDLQVNRNLNINGNITIGGTSATIFTQTLNVFDPDIVLGFRTDALGNDVSNDNTANHGGVALASTEGTPLVQLFIAGIETNPATYKKIMWFKAGEFAGLGTDAWLMNYAVGIGSTQFPTGTRLAAGAVQITERDLTVVRNINASGIITGTLANNLTLNTSGIGLSGISTYNNSGSTTFTITSNATSNNTSTTIVARDSSGNFSAGTITANLTGTASTASFATTAYNLTDAANIITGTINSSRLSGTYNISISGNSSTATYATSAGIATYASNAGIATYATSAGIATYASNAGIATYAETVGIATYASNAGIATYATSAGIATYATSAGIATYASNAGIATYAETVGIATYATSAGIATYASNAGIATYATSAGIATYSINSGVSTSVIGGISSVTQLQVTGVSTFTNGPLFIGTSSTTGTANQNLQVFGGASFTGTNYNIGIGTTNPLYTITVTDTGTPATIGLTNCLADFTTTANSYGQINLRNTSAGTNASGDIIITADNGNDLSNFIDLGINNSGFSVGSWTINGTNDGYLYTSDGNLSIGAINASVPKYISFFTGGTLISNERMRINSTGVGIGTTNPIEVLQVQGNISINGLVSYGSSISTTATISQTAIYSGLSTSTYRSVEYTILATRGTNYHATKILAIHDGSIAYNSEYGSIYNNGVVGTFDVDISGGNIRLLVTPTSASTTNYSISFIATKI